VTSGRRSALGLLAATLIVACGAQSDDPAIDPQGGSPTLTGGTGGAGAGPGVAGAGGDDDRSAGGAMGTAGAGADAGASGEVGQGAGGTGILPPTDSDSIAAKCSGLYAPDAPWPGEGRCAGRGGRTPVAGPRSFDSKAEVSLGTPLRVSPIIGAKGIFVASDKGVYEIDLALESPPVLVLEGSFASPPVLTATTVYGVSTDGVLHFAAQGAGSGNETTLDLRLQTDSTFDQTRTWSSAPLLSNTQLLVATPWGQVARVDLTKELETGPVVEARISTAGQLSSARAAIVLDQLGAVYLPTNIGLFRTSADGTQLDRLGEEPVPATPVGTGRGVIFTETSGRLHQTIASAGETPGAKDLVDDYPGQALEAGAGAMSSLGQFRFAVATGKSLRVVTVNDTDTNGPVLDATDDTPFFSTTGPIEAPGATDGEGVQYLASTDGNIYIVNIDGALLDSYLTGGALLAQPALAGNAVYLGSTDGTVYRLAGAKP
jgi:hypothetical protein